jgi:hypothetical protein
MTTGSAKGKTNPKKATLDPSSIGLKNKGAVPEPQGGVAAEKEVLSAVPEGLPAAPVNAPDALEESLERQVTALGRKTAERLRKRPKIKTLIPKDKLNPNDEYVVVGINGWNFQIKRDTWLMLPAPVVNLLQEAGYQPTTQL